MEVVERDIIKIKMDVNDIQAIVGFIDIIDCDEIKQMVSLEDACKIIKFRNMLAREIS
jgi:hypothetical protein